MNALTKQAASFSESMIPQCLENAAMDPTLFDTYGVKRGLRDKAGNGVVAGLTNISDVSAYWFDEQGNKHPQEGKLSYRGYNINDLVNGFVREKRFGFEETTYLLLFSKLPDEKELAEHMAPDDYETIFNEPPKVEIRFRLLELLTPKKD